MGKTTLFRVALFIGIAFYPPSETWAQQWQKDMVCQGSCGGGCGPCPTTGPGSQQRADPPRGPSAADIARNKAEILHQKGLDAYHDGDYTTALALLEEARRVWPATFNIGNDLDSVSGAIERKKSATSFAGGLDAVNQKLLNERTSNTSELNSGKGELKFMPVDGAYVPSGSALVGGTGWIFGYNMRPGSKPDLLVRSQAIAKRLAEAEGVPYNEKIDFNKYNFVLGIATSTDIFNDLTSRVVFDEFSNGQFTAVQQQAYNSLKGRQFDELACHSNGAMICLAALKNRDIVAKHVHLFGPQITPESLYMWNELVRSGQISTIQIYINRGDPVPATSMLSSNPTVALTAAVAPILAAPLFNADVLSKAVVAFAPSMNVKIYDCSSVTLTTACHDMAVYKKNSGGQADPGK